ncbi:MAG: hypothetical protein AVDCRST_MAG49-1857, partial [uncultured Thermomicrobiales bacterium]
CRSSRSHGRAEGLNDRPGAGTRPGNDDKGDGRMAVPLPDTATCRVRSRSP